MSKINAAYKIRILCIIIKTKFVNKIDIILLQSSIDNISTKFMDTKSGTITFSEKVHRGIWTELKLGMNSGNPGCLIIVHI